MAHFWVNGVVAQRDLKPYIKLSNEKGMIAQGRPIPSGDARGAARGDQCDFCSAAGAARDYHNRAFGVRTRVGILDVQEGIWAACAECAAFIDAGRWEILVERAVNRHAGPTDDNDGWMSEYFRTIYGALRESLKDERLREHVTQS